MDDKNLIDSKPVTSNETTEELKNYYKDCKLEEEYKDIDREYLKKMAIPCAIYALVYVLCMYKNHGNIMTFVWAVSLAAIVVYSIKSFGKELKKGSIFLICSMVVIGLASFFSATGFFANLGNNVAIFLLLVTLVLHNYADDLKWDLGKYLLEILSISLNSIGYMLKPFEDGKASKSQTEENKNATSSKIMRGLLISIPFLIILGGLLISSDAILSSTTIGLLEGIEISGNVIIIILMLFLGFFGSYCGLRYAYKKGENIEYKVPRTGEPIATITVMTIISILYLAYSMVQVLFLFFRGFTLPNGISYAEYAREGFFQLLVVCFLNLIIVLFVKKHIERNRLLDAVLLVICACTYIMIASSAMRMAMYIDYYNLTFMRIFVLVALLTIGIILAGVIIFVVNENFPLAKFAIATITVVYICFAFSRVDYHIAKYNLERSDLLLSTDEDYYECLDLFYQLRADAAPAIEEYFDSHGYDQDEKCRIAGYVGYYRRIYNETKNMNFRTFNLSRYKANKLMPETCRTLIIESSY